MTDVTVEYYAKYDNMKARRDMLESDGFTCVTTPIFTYDGETFWRLKGAL